MIDNRLSTTVIVSAAPFHEDTACRLVAGRAVNGIDACNGHYPRSVMV